MANIKVNLTRGNRVIYEDTFIGPTPTITYLLFEPMNIFDMYSPFHESELVILTRDQITKGRETYKRILQEDGDYSGTFYGNTINYGDLDEGLSTQVFMNTTPEYLVYLERKLDKLYDVLIDFSDDVGIQFSSV